MSTAPNVIVKRARVTGLAFGLLLVGSVPEIFASVTGSLEIGSAGSMTITETSIALSPDLSANPAGPPWNAEVAALTSLKFAGCPSGALGIPGCLDAAPFLPAEGIAIGSITSSTTLPFAGFLIFAGNGVTHASVSYTLTSIGPGAVSTACTTATSVGDSCSFTPGSPLLLTKSAGGTTISLPLAGTVTDGLGSPTAWSGGLAGSIAGMTPADVQTSIVGAGSIVVPVSGELVVPLVPGVDLLVTKSDGVASAAPGTTVTYTIAVSNNGTVDVTGATVTDSFPAAITSATWTCVGAGGGTCTASGTGDISDTVNLPSAASVTYTVHAAISPSATGSLSNTATVAPPGGVTDVDLTNNSSTDTDTLTPRADVSVGKTGPAAVLPGVPIVYQISVANAGPSDAQSVSLTDVLPAGTTFFSQHQLSGPAFTLGNTTTSIDDTIGTLAAGASATFQIMVSTSSSIAPGTTLSNTATVSASTPDPNTGNNSSTVDTVASPPVPVLSPLGFLLMAAALLGAGLFALRRA